MWGTKPATRSREYERKAKNSDPKTRTIHDDVPANGRDVQRVRSACVPPWSCACVNATIRIHAVARTPRGPVSHPRDRPTSCRHRRSRRSGVTFMCVTHTRARTKTAVLRGIHIIYLRLSIPYVYIYIFIYVCAYNIICVLVCRVCTVTTRWVGERRRARVSPSHALSFEGDDGRFAACFDVARATG